MDSSSGWAMTRRMLSFGVGSDSDSDVVVEGDDGNWSGDLLLNDARTLMISKYIFSNRKVSIAASNRDNSYNICDNMT